jgi:hypothetical protein
MDIGTSKDIILVLMGLAGIWVIRVAAKRETENLLRAALLLILLGAILFYLQHTKLEKITWAGIRGEIKDTFFPEKAPNYVYTKEDGWLGQRSYVRYYFEPPGPKLALRLDKNEKYFEITDIRSVNRILEYIGLPPVEAAVPELASVTGSRNDLAIYRWDDYPTGELRVERGICQNRDTLDSYECIVSIMLVRR